MRSPGPRGAALEGPRQHARVIGDLTSFLTESIEELDVELGDLKFERRFRAAWELRGRRAALGEIALWLDERCAEAPKSSRPRRRS